MDQNFAGAMFADPFAPIDTVGLVAFALVGATEAIREDLDLFEDVYATPAVLDGSAC